MSVFALLERVVLRFDREESPQQKFGKLEGFLVQYGLPLAETVPLFTSLLSLSLPADYAPLTVPPEQQKQQTLHALLTILLRIAAQQPLLFVMEDLHWVDPTTLELLSLLVDQGPTARILVLLTFRPDFSPPWTGRSHLTQVTLRFDREESQQQKLRKLEGLLVQYGLNLVEAMPLLAALLSLPLTADYAPLTVSPEQQKQQILQALLTIMLRTAAQQPMLFVMEDLHWVDPTTLEIGRAHV